MPQDLEPWQSKLRDKDSSIRYKAVKEFAALGRADANAAQLLSESLNDEYSSVQDYAADALGEIGAEAGVAVPALIRLLDVEYRRSYAARALGNIGPQAQAAVVPLCRALKEGYIRKEAAKALGGIRAPSNEATEPLCLALKDRDRDVRLEAAHSLACIRPTTKECILALSQALEDTDEYVRLESVRALASIRPTTEECILALSQALENSHIPVAIVAAAALEQVGTAANKAVPQLHNALNRNKDLGRIELSLELRRAAAYALAAVEPKELETDKDLEIVNAELAVAHERLKSIDLRLNSLPFSLDFVILQRLDDNTYEINQNGTVAVLKTFNTVYKSKGRAQMPVVARKQSIRLQTKDGFEGVYPLYEEALDDVGLFSLKADDLARLQQPVYKDRAETEKKIDNLNLRLSAAATAYSIAATSESRVRRDDTARNLGVPIEMINSLEMKFSFIPAGEFLMGSPESDTKKDAEGKPQHRVRITKPFYLGQTAVTQWQWKAVMNIRHWDLEGSMSRAGNNYPVMNVSWDDATEFCRKLSAKEGKIYRLPTEAEWEYACRAGTKTKFHFGDDDSRYHDYDLYLIDESPYEVYVVGSKRANPWDLYDMHGNVWEWCSDWYGAYGESPATDPTGPVEGDDRVFRGGGRSATRKWNKPVLRRNHLGFRVVLVP